MFIRVINVINLQNDKRVHIAYKILLDTQKYNLCNIQCIIYNNNIHHI